jgi:NAD(P)-dependent dehydrogenase (short-subunit alcohol dehydrogenase family)
VVTAALEGRRLLVVGASAGIGRALAGAAVADGADVVLAARRKERLDEVVAHAGGGTPVAVDVGDPDAVERLGEVVGAGPPLDAVVTCAGVSPLRKVADMTAVDWDSVLRTNVVGFSNVMRAVLPSLAPAAVVAALSSETIDQPRPALAGYTASKAALEAAIRGWRIEHPGRRFTCIRIGATFPTEFGDAFDADLLGPTLEEWASRGLMQEEFMATDDVGRVLVDLLATLLDHPGVSFDDVVVRSPSAVVGSAWAAIDNASGTRENGELHE